MIQLLKSPPTQNVWFAYCYFTWMFALQSAEKCVCSVTLKDEEVVVVVELAMV